MYVIKSDNDTIHRGDTTDKDYRIISGTLKMQYNMAGTLTFTVPPNNRSHKANKIKKLVSVIKVYRIESNNGDKLIWKGRVIDHEKNIFNQVTYTCEGWLAVLNDILLHRVPKYTDSATKKSIDFNGDSNLDETLTWDTAKAYNGLPSIMFKGLINAYNSGKNVKSGDKYYLNPSFTNYANYEESTCFNFPSIDGYVSVLDYLESNVINANSDGGHLWVGDTVIHYDINVDQKVNIAQQEIRFGSNLLDLTYGLSASNICSRLYAKGVTTNTSKEQTVYTSIYSQAMIDTYGYIDKYYDFGYVYDKDDLKRLAKNKFQTLSKYAVTISLSSINLAAFGTDADRIRVGDYVKVISEPNNVQKAIICTGVEFDMVNPEKASYEFGVNADTLSSLQIRTTEQIMANNTSYVQWIKNETMETGV